MNNLIKVSLLSFTILASATVVQAKSQDTQNVQFGNRTDIVCADAMCNLFCIDKSKQMQLDLSRNCDNNFDTHIPVGITQGVDVNVQNNYAQVCFTDGSYQGLGSPVANHVIVISGVTSDSRFITLFPSDPADAPVFSNKVTTPCQSKK